MKRFELNNVQSDVYDKVNKEVNLKLFKYTS